MNKKYIQKNLDHPDEKRQFPHGRLDLLDLDTGEAIGRATFEPGWKWSNDVKPIAGTQSCEAEHRGCCLTGSMTVIMNNGDKFQIKSGDAFYIPPGHDAWVDGDESCVLLDFAGFKDYAKQKQKAA